MKCPDCHHELQISQLKGLRIHECLKCKSKWFEKNQDAVKDFNKIFTGDKGFVSKVRDSWELLKILKIRIAIEHPRLEQVWENIESVTPFR